MSPILLDPVPSPLQVSHTNSNAVSAQSCIAFVARSALRSFAEAETEAKAEVGVNDLFNGGAPQSQQTINANELDIGSEDLQKCCANEASQA